MDTHPGRQSESSETLDEVSPLPQAEAAAAGPVRGGPSSSATVLTSTPYKKDLELAQLRKTKPKETFTLKSRRAIKQKLFEEEIEKSDSELSLDESLDEEVSEGVDFGKLASGDFVLAELNCESLNNKKSKNFLCFFLGPNYDSRPWKKRGKLQQSAKQANVFVFPIVEDRMMVKEEIIITQLRPTFERRGRFCFSVKI